MIESHIVLCIPQNKSSFLAFLGSLLLFIVFLILVLVLILVLAARHLEQPQKEAQAVLDDGDQLLDDLVALVELIRIFADIPVEEHIEERLDLLPLEHLAQTRRLVVGLLALVGQPVAGLPSGDVALDAERFPIREDELPREDSLIEVGIGLENELERDAVGRPLDKLNVLEILQGLLVLLGYEICHPAVLQGCIPVPIYHFSLGGGRLLAGLEVIGQCFKFGGERVLALYQLRGLYSRMFTLSRRGLILSAQCLCTRWISISCQSSTCSLCLRRELSATTGTRYARGSPRMRSSIVGPQLCIGNIIWWREIDPFIYTEGHIYYARKVILGRNEVGFDVLSGIERDGFEMFLFFLKEMWGTLLCFVDKNEEGVHSIDINDHSLKEFLRTASHFFSAISILLQNFSKSRRLPLLKAAQRQVCLSISLSKV